MHAVIKTSDSSFFQYWNRLCANDPVQNPIYMQQRCESKMSSNSITEFTDRSFLVMLAEEPIFGCSLTLHLDEQGRKCIGYFGREASSHMNQATMQTTSNSFRPEAIRLLREHINQLIEEIQPHAIDYLDPVSCGVMSPITQVLLEKGGDTNCAASANSRFVNFETPPAAQHDEKLPRVGCMGSKKSRHKNRKRRSLRCLAS